MPSGLDGDDRVVSLLSFKNCHLHLKKIMWIKMKMIWCSQVSSIHLKLEKQVEGGKKKETASQGQDFHDTLWGQVDWLKIKS